MLLLSQLSYEPQSWTVGRRAPTKWTTLEQGQAEVAAACGVAIAEIARVLVRGENTVRFHLDLDTSAVSSERSIWANMKQRCLNSNNTSYQYYGARGITVCARWLRSFDSFLADVGPRPGPEYQLDRIDNNGNYEPANCRWVTPKENSANRRKRKPAAWLS